MRFFSVNGSPHGRASQTERLVQAFLEGARSGGAETEELFLSELRIEYCRGCHSCWTKTPGRCVVDDDLAVAIAKLRGSDLLVLATPLHFVHASGQLKTFIDRLTSMGGSPHDPPKAQAIEGGTGAAAGRATVPRLAIMATCGHPRIGQFRSLSLWMEDLAELLCMELYVEGFVPSAKRLSSDAAIDLVPSLSYLDLLRAAGGAAARGEALSTAARQALRSGF